MSGAPHAAFHPRGPAWLITVCVTMAPFMEILDSTIVNVGLPHIAGNMSVSYDEATWTITSYLVANGIVVPVSGWLGRLFGRKRYFLMCIAAFTFMSFLCGVATSLDQLVIFRLLQGLFGGGLQPSQQSIILDTYEPAQRSKGFSFVAGAVIFAPILGPVLGGWITDAYSWRWMFLMNVPIGIFAFFAVLHLLEDPPWVIADRVRARDIDYVGLSLIAVGLGALQFMLDRGQDLDWFESAQIRILALVAGATILGAIIWLSLADNPIVSLRALGDRNFAVGAFCTFAIGALLYSSNAFIPLLAQGWFGYTALTSGWLMSPGAALMLVLIPASAKWILPNLPTRLVLGFGFFSMGTAAAYASHLTPDIDFWTLASFRAVQTVGFAFLFVPNSTLSYATMPRALHRDATALYSMFRNIGGAIGVSAGTALVSNRIQAHRGHLAIHLTPQEGPYPVLLAQYEHAIQGMGIAADRAHGMALGALDRMLNLQAAVLAYSDVYTVSA
ncbi:MAG: DHA2 family efflux MFS transporter permease subunit, partial [Rhodospirillales bacterium]